MKRQILITLILVLFSTSCAPSQQDIEETAQASVAGTQKTIPTEIRLQPESCDSDEDVIANEHCYKICSDLHLYKKGIESEKPNITILENANFKERTLYIGDIFDLKNAVQHTKTNRKDECSELVRKDIDELSNILGGNYLRGNHELDACKNCPIYKVINDVLFTHGHYLCWPEDVIKDWESGNDRPVKPGCDNYKECISDCIKGAVEYAEGNSDINTIVFGHTHPYKTDLIRVEIERKKEGNTVKDFITIINVTKGCTYIEFP